MANQYTAFERRYFELEAPDECADRSPCLMLYNVSSTTIRNDYRKLMNPQKDEVVMHECNRGVHDHDKNGGTCLNEKHLKLGTHSENLMYAWSLGRRTGNKIGGKISGKINCNRMHTCPHCGKVGKSPVMFSVPLRQLQTKGHLT